MNKRLLTLLFVVIAIISAFLVLRGNQKDKFLTEEIYSMNTIANIKIAGKERKEAMDAVIEEINYLNGLFDDFSEASDVSRINKSAGNNFEKVSEDTIDIINKAIDCFKLSDGSFDITIAPVEALWGFKDGNYKVPGEEEIKDALESVGIENIEITDSSVKLKNKGARIDLGGIAKGYTLDKIKEILDKYEVECAIVNLGGNILTYKNPQSGSWKIGIKHPRREGIIGEIEVTGTKFISTSGDYERFFMNGDKRYCHIINPFNGYPSALITSVSVISDSGYIGDALSTAFFVKGQDYAFKIAREVAVEAVVVDSNLEVYATEGIKEYLKLETR